MALSVNLWHPRISPQQQGELPPFEDGETEFQEMTFPE